MLTFIKTGYTRRIQMSWNSLINFRVLQTKKIIIIITKKRKTVQYITRVLSKQENDNVPTVINLMGPKGVYDGLL